jgi:hypothetical protein
MGVHLLNVCKNTSDASKEIRYRVWWSVYVLETMLSVMTGRPFSVPDQSCTAPLPLPFDEEQFCNPSVARLLGNLDSRIVLMRSLLLTGGPPSAWDLPRIDSCLSLYFLFSAELARISRRAIDALCAPAWTDLRNGLTELAMDEFFEIVDGWRTSLLGLSKLSGQQDVQTSVGEQLCLTLRFYSVKITVSRILIDCWDRQGANSGQQVPAQGRKRVADICMDSACNMLSHLPDNPNLDLLARVGRWWYILHFIMQSMIALFIELDSHLETMQKNLITISACIQKGMLWLSAMAARDAGSKRAWQVCYGLYLRLAHTLPPAFASLNPM